MGVTFNENHIAVQQCMKRAYQVEDRGERQRILRQFHHHHPTSDFVTANLARESDNPEEIRKLVHFLSDRVARGLTKKSWLDIALEALVEKETDENLPETLNEYTESIQNSREYRLASRYTARLLSDREWISISIDPIDHVYLSTSSVDRLFVIRMAGQYGEWLGDLVHHPRWVAAEEKIRSAAG